MGFWTFDADFTAAFLSYPISRAPRLKFEIVDDWAPSGQATFGATMICPDLEEIVDVSPFVARFENAAGRIAIETHEIVITNVAKTATRSWEGLWARVYWGDDDAGWRPLWHGIITSVVRNGDATATITVQHQAEELLRRTLAKMEAWFDDESYVFEVYAGTSNLGNPNNGNFVEEHRPRLVKGDWEFRTGGEDAYAPIMYAGTANYAQLAGLWPAYTGTYLTNDSDVLWFEFQDQDTYYYWWESNPSRIYDANTHNGTGPGYSRNTAVVDILRWNGASDDTVAKLHGYGWNDESMGKDATAPTAFVKKINTGDLYRADVAGPKTGSGTFGYGRFNAVEIIREIVMDLFSDLVRPPLTYGLDGAAETWSGDAVKPIIDTSADDWTDAAAAADNDSVELRGAFPAGTSGLGMIQGALDVLRAGMWVGPEGGLHIAAVAPTPGSASVRVEGDAAAGQNALDVGVEDDQTDRILRVTVRFLALTSGMEAERIYDAGSGSYDDRELERHSVSIGVGWRLTEALAGRIASTVFLRSEDVPTRYTAAGTLYGIPNAGVFESVDVNDDAADVKSQTAKLVAIAIDPLDAQTDVVLLNEPKLEAELYFVLGTDVLNNGKLIL